MGELIWANFRARPVRTLLAITAVGVQVFLLLFMMGLTEGMIREWRERLEGIGADLMVQPPGASIFPAFWRASLQENLAQQLQEIPGVEVVSPTIAAPNSRGISVIYGIDYPTFNQLGTGFRFEEPGDFDGFGGDFEVIVDDIKAEAQNLTLGKTVELFDLKWEVSGIVQNGRGARFFIPLRTAQEILNVPGMVSVFWVEVAEPGLVNEVQERIVAVLPRHEVRRMDEYLSLMSPQNIPLIDPFTNAVIFVGVVITFLVVLLSMYTIVLERTHEIGILKALGASRFDIVSLMVREALLIGVLGVGVGLAFSFGFRAVFLATRPTMTVDITQVWVLRGALLALLGCALGSLYPAMRASSMDAVEALGSR